MVRKPRSNLRSQVHEVLLERKGQGITIDEIIASVDLSDPDQTIESKRTLIRALVYRMRKDEHLDIETLVQPSKDRGSTIYRLVNRIE